MNITPGSVIDLYSFEFEGLPKIDELVASGKLEIVAGQLLSEDPSLEKTLNDEIYVMHDLSPTNNVLPPKTRPKKGSAGKVAKKNRSKKRSAGKVA